MAKIKTFSYNSSQFDQIKNDTFGRNWPVVYVLEGSKEAYVGETADIYTRCNQHYKNPERRKLDQIHVVADEEFNKSATLDIESLLIQYISADGKFMLQNGNAGLQNHQYFNKEYYEAKFEEIWSELLRINVAKHSLVELKNSDIFKYSPYKALSDDQLEVAKAIIKEILTTESNLYIVSGEPGSGKTILAIYLVKYLQQLKNVDADRIGLVVPMTSLRKTIKQVFKSIKGLKASMVIGPNDVVKKEYDILIVDEAHRLSRRKSLTSYQSFDEVNRLLKLDIQEGTQLDWVRKSAKHLVLLYDGGQRVRPSDIPAEYFHNLSGQSFFLKSQMRVLGGSKYIDYIENILKENQKDRIDFDDCQYEFKLFEDVNEMIERIKKLNIEHELCRNVAGFAWDWISKEDKSLYDIQIEDYQYRWNDTNIDWVNSSTAINEVGCIHGVHGYDLNYTGVIIGPELIYNNGHLEIVPKNYRDKKGKIGIADNNILKEYILNIYKVLLTRGIKGTYIYACDEGLRRYLEQFVPVELSYGNRTIQESLIAEESSEYKGNL